MNLSPEQRRAVGRLGQDVCVVAGPGSGKTRVLVERFRWRVEQGLSPLRLLTVTFTEKAANELKQRLARDFRGQGELRGQIERAPVQTIDAFCARLLREHAIEAGIDPAFEVLEPADAYSELYAAAEEALDALFEEKPQAVRALLAALDLRDPVASLIEVYQAMRLTVAGSRRGPEEPASVSTAPIADLLDSARRIVSASPAGWSPGQAAALAAVREWCGRLLALASGPVSLEHFRLLAGCTWKLTSFRRNNHTYEEIKALRNTLVPAAREALVTEYYAPQRVLLWEAVERAHRAYGERKQALNALDFADLEELALRLLRDNEKLRQRVRDSFDEILMDEVQDTNPLQAELIEQVRRPDRFFAVGDINQSIYGFRHANPEVFRSYRERIRAGGKPIDRLAANYRSRASILDAAALILRGAEGIEPHALEAARPFRDKEEPSVEVIAAAAATAEEAADLEARLVAQRIRELAGALLIEERDTRVARPARFSDCVILVRNIHALPPFENALHQAGIPYLIGRGKRFYEAQEVTDLVHLLRVLANRRDETSMAAVLRSPLVGVGNETLLRLKQSGNMGAALMAMEIDESAGFESGDLDRLRNFRDVLRELRARADDVSPDRLLLRAMDAAGYETQLNARARANVRKLLARVRDWFERRPQPLAKLVRELEFLRAADPDEPTAPPEDSADAVRIMTVHAAKGLEFSIVFLAALHKGVARELPPVSFSRGAGLVARWLDPVSGVSIRDRYYAAYAEELRRKEGEEENRLLYVAITRAEEHVVLSFARTERRASNWAEMVIAGLALRLETPTNQPYVHELIAERPLPVRVLYADAAAAAALAAEAAAAGEILPEPLDRPAVAGQHDSRASVTSIALFEDCPRRYYLARYLGWQPRPALLERRDAEDDSLDAGELGRQVHEILAEAQVKDAAPLALDLAARFQMSELGRRAAFATRIEREFDFLLSIEDMLLEGRIDLWFEEGGELVLVDYKTDDVGKSEAAEHAESYAVQLRLYAMALERVTGRVPNRALLYFLRPDAVVPVALDSACMEAARETVRSFQQAQAEMRFPLRTGERCRRCPFHRGACPAAIQ